MNYRGRFAPSPTGPLHFGSLVAAVGSYLDARHHGGDWLVRIEDLDPPREVAGASDDILRTLEAYGLSWDAPVTYQSQRSRLYEQALETLRDAGHSYDCGCSRSEIAAQSGATDSSPIYPGTCRNGLPPGRKPRAVRVRTDNDPVRISDRLQAPFSQRLERETGDFVVRRADGLHAYQLAVVVDDAAQAISHVVRGADLLDSTPRQRHLQSLLALPVPAWLHLPVAVDRDGAKLSKQNQALPVTAGGALATAIDTLQFLGQPVPESAADATLDELWQWASLHWNVEAIPARHSLPAPPHYLATP